MSLTRRSWILILLWAAMALGGGAFAAESGRDRVPERASAVVEAPDVQVQQAERERRVQARTERAKREAEFNQLDSDGDGYLSRQELAAKQDLKPGPDALDRDDDGKVSRTEFAAVETSSVGPDDPPGSGS